MRSCFRQYGLDLSIQAEQGEQFCQSRPSRENSYVQPSRTTPIAWVRFAANIS